MPTFSSSSLISSAIKQFVAAQPILLTPLEIDEVGPNAHLVGFNAILNIQSNNTGKPFSPRLINWVEPYLISGYTKTLFYTEVNSGLKVGDRVFIANGNYDSNALIKKDKYKKGRDGYKVLYIDRCAIVLDIDYTGVLPYNSVTPEEFVNVYYIRNLQDFKHANRQITTKRGIFDYKFNPYNGNIIYADKDYGAEIGWGETLGLTGSPGFYVKNGTHSWTNITSQFISGSFSLAVGATSSINKIKINNYSFTYSIGPSVTEFKEDYIYQWDMGFEPDAVPGTYSTWINDITYNIPIISKGSFRDGLFYGVWNTGLFGTSEKRIKWTGHPARWYNGTLLNTKWLSGKINSMYTLSESYITEFDNYGLPYQKVTNPDNNGKGYNFIISSELVSATIQNGTIIDTIIGQTPTYSLVQNYMMSSTMSYSNTIQQAAFENCRFLGGFIENAELKNTRAINTYFKNIKAVNSNFKSSIIKDSNYLSDEIIKILGYDELNYNLVPSINGPSHKVYKFYITKSNYERLKIRDRFYLKGLKFNNNSSYPLNLFDKRFRVSSWSEYYDEISATHSYQKRGFEVGAFLSTPSDNAYKYNNFITGGTIITGANTNNQYSVDIVLSTYDINNSSINIGSLNFNYDTTPTPNWGNQTIMFKYNDSGIDYQEILNPAGTYNGYPYYILTNQTGFPYSYVFFTASNNRWEHWQLFDPISGNTYGSDFYCTLTYSGVAVPDTSTNNWIQAVDLKMISSSLVYVAPTMPPYSLGNILDVSNAWILDSDFESGLFENSNWNSGYHMNYNNDVNMTKNPSIGKYYNIVVATSSQSLIIDTLYNSQFVESGEDCLSVGNVVYLNAVDWDTSGKIDSIVITATGSSYSTATNLTTTGGSGEDFVLDITDTSGAITSATIVFGGHGYELGDVLTISSGNFDGTVTVTSVTGSKTRLPDSYIITNNTLGTITLQEIVTGSQSIIEGLSNNGIAYTTDAQNRWGYIYKSKFSKSKIKDGIFRRGYFSECLIDNDTYNENDRDFSNLEKIRSLLITDSIFSNNANILSKATYMNSSFVGGNDDHITGIIYNSIWNGMTFSDGIFKQGRWVDGTFKNGLFYNSRSFDGKATASYPYYWTERTKNYFKDGETDAILANDRYSWQNGKFLNGQFYKGDWENGEFIDGKFYYSKFYGGTISGGIIGDNSIPSENTHIYSATVSNTTVENAFFYAIDSSYYDTTPNGYYYTPSKINWYNGVFNNGIFGSDLSQSNQTGNPIRFIYTDSVVTYHEILYPSGTYDGYPYYVLTNETGTTYSYVFFTSSTTSAIGGTFSGPRWEHWQLFDPTSGNTYGSDFYGVLTYSGIDVPVTDSDYLFRDGGAAISSGSSISSSTVYIPATSNTAIWYNGTFNNGQFITNARWKYGKFNGGKFISGYGWTMSSSTYSTDYGWEDGIFNGGEFGNAQTATNSTWYKGEFNNGTFKGRLWNNGIFTGGNFYGSGGTYSATGGFSSSNASIFTDSFTNSFYGYWRDGFVSALKDQFNFDDKSFSPILSPKLFTNPTPEYKMQDMLWETGTFSHDNIGMYNSVWFDGAFQKGLFYNSSFNPYVKRFSTTTPSFNLNDATCYWDNGIFEGGDFYLSEFREGTFNTGNAYGMIWKNGVSNYMNAFNVFWEGGLWRNGNWYGSYFTYDGDVVDDFTLNILNRGISWSGTSSCHVWNIFQDNTDNESLITSSTNSVISGGLITQQDTMFDSFSSPI